MSVKENPDNMKKKFPSNLFQRKSWLFSFLLLSLLLLFWLLQVLAGSCFLLITHNIHSSKNNIYYEGQGETCFQANIFLVEDLYKMSWKHLQLTIFCVTRRLLDGVLKKSQRRCFTNTLTCLYKRSRKYVFWRRLGWSIDCYAKDVTI